MKNKWQAAFEVAKYTNYDFLHYDNDTEIIWLKDRKKKTLMCLIDLDLTDSELEEITDNIAEALGHGTSKWSVEGIDNQHDIVLVSMLRSEIHRFQHVVRDTDDSAFVTILTGQSVYGKGFQSIHPQMPLGLDEVEA